MSTFEMRDSRNAGVTPGGRKIQNPAPRYRRSGLAAEALKRALRNRVSNRQFDTAPGGYKYLTPGQQALIQRRVDRQFGSLQARQPTMKELNPALRAQFLRQKKMLQTQAKNKAAREAAQKAANPPPLGPGDDPSIGQDPYTPPTVTVNENGQLDLPYSEGMTQDIIDAKESANQALLGMQQEEQQQGLEYQQMLRDANFDYKDAAKQALNSYAGRGMAFSSGYGNAVAENANQFNQYVNDLNQSDTLFKQGMGSQRAQLQNSLNDMLRRWGLRRAGELEGQAGDLGYGQSTPGVTEQDKAAQQKAKKVIDSSKAKREARAKAEDTLKTAFRIDIRKDRFGGKKISEMTDKEKAMLQRRVLARMATTGGRAKNVKDANVRAIYKRRLSKKPEGSKK